MRYTEERRETASIGAFADTGAAEEDPLNVPVLGIFASQIDGGGVR